MRVTNTKVLTFALHLGSDCTSSFYGKGKVKAWKTLIAHPCFVETFSLLGYNFPPANVLVRDLNKFTCLLYGDNTSKNADECRYTMFKGGKCSDEVLPPTCDSLLRHIERVNYQAGVWCQSLLPQMTLPSPIGNGWQFSNGDIDIVWMTRPPAPDSLLDFVDCHCKTGCSSMRCSCRKANLVCTDLCSCVNCENTSGECDEDNSIDDSDSESTDGDLDDIDQF